MTTDNIRHAPFCMAQPGESGPRIESFRSERTNANGVVISCPVIPRCVECGEQTVTG